MVNVEGVSWYLNSLPLSAHANKRIQIYNKRNGQVRSTLVFDPVHYSDSGTATNTSCVSIAHRLGYITLHHKVLSVANEMHKPIALPANAAWYNAFGRVCLSVCLFVML